MYLVRADLSAFFFHEPEDTEGFFEQRKTVCCVRSGRQSGFPKDVNPMDREGFLKSKGQLSDEFHSYWGGFGQAICNLFVDQFSRAKGRKISLARALEDASLPRHVRRQAWRDYFNIVGKKGMV